MDHLEQELLKLSSFQGFTGPIGGIFKKKPSFGQEAGKFFKSVGKGALPSLALAAAFYTIASGIGAISKVKEKRAKDPAFDAMIKMHPELLKEDPDNVIKYFDSLYHFAPHMAQEPLAAGAYITQMLRAEVFGGPTVDIVKTVSEVQDKGKKSPDKMKEEANRKILTTFAEGMANAWGAST